jgi:hypothetical protein
LTSWPALAILFASLTFFIYQKRTTMNSGMRVMEEGTY